MLFLFVVLQYSSRIIFRELLGLQFFTGALTTAADQHTLLTLLINTTMISPTFPLSSRLQLLGDTCRFSLQFSW